MGLDGMDGAQSVGNVVGKGWGAEVHTCEESECESQLPVTNAGVKLTESVTSDDDDTCQSRRICSDNLSRHSSVTICHHLSASVRVPELGMSLLQREVVA